MAGGKRRGERRGINRDAFGDAERKREGEIWETAAAAKYFPARELLAPEDPPDRWDLAPWFRIGPICR